MLLSNKSTVTWHARNIEYYESLGYEYSRIGDQFEINTEELPRHSKVYVLVKCDYCGTKFKTKYRVHLDGREKIKKDACQKCGKKKVDEITIIEKGSLKENHPDLMREWSPKNTLDPSKILSGTRLSAYWICDRGHEWYTSIKARALRGEGCPLCYASKGETKVEETLIKSRIEYEREKSFEGLVGVWGKPLRFDFSLYKDGELIGLIEYDGIFHFEDVYEGCNHKNIVIHDKRKEAYCKSKRIPLLIIPYTDYDKIDKLIMEFVKELDAGEEAMKGFEF